MPAIDALPEPEDAKTGDIRVLIIDGRPRLQVRMPKNYSYDQAWIEPAGIELHEHHYPAKAVMAFDATVTPAAVYIVPHEPDVK